MQGRLITLLLWTWAFHRSTPPILFQSDQSMCQETFAASSKIFPNLKGGFLCQSSIISSSNWIYCNLFCIKLKKKLWSNFRLSIINNLGISNQSHMSNMPNPHHKHKNDGYALISYQNRSAQFTLLVLGIMYLCINIRWIRCMNLSPEVEQIPNKITNMPSLWTNKQNHTWVNDGIPNMCHLRPFS